MEVFFVVEECTGPVSVDREGWSETKKEDTLLAPIDTCTSRVMTFLKPEDISSILANTYNPL